MKDARQDLCVSLEHFDIAFVGRGWKVPMEGHRNRYGEFGSVDMGSVEFVDCLTPAENRITGEEKLGRLDRNRAWVCLGTSVFMGLWKNYRANKENSILEKLHQRSGITYLDFFGDVLENVIDMQGVLYLSRADSGSWGWSIRGLTDYWSALDLSAVKHLSS